VAIPGGDIFEKGSLRIDPARRGQVVRLLWEIGFDIQGMFSTVKVEN